jgi:hypothetical protein
MPTARVILKTLLRLTWDKITCQSRGLKVVNMAGVEDIARGGLKCMD